MQQGTAWPNEATCIVLSYIVALLQNIDTDTAGYGPNTYQPVQW